MYEKFPRLDFCLRTRGFRHSKDKNGCEIINFRPWKGRYSALNIYFNIEKYVTMDIPKPHRSIFAQFRCGVLPIRIETGRFRGEEVNDRLCIICSVEAIEDEFHFLLHCTSYSKLRTEFFTSIGFNNRLLNMSDSDCTGFLLSNFPRQTAKFVYSAFMCRQSILFKNSNA